MSKTTKRILFIAAAAAAGGAAYAGFLHRRSLLGAQAEALKTIHASVLEIGKQLRAK